MAQKKVIRHHEIVKTVAENLRQQRKRLGMSQQDLAQRAQVSLTYIGKLERGESSVGVDMLARLAESMGVSASSLIPDSQVKTGVPDAVKTNLRKQFERIMSRNDTAALQSLSVVISLMDNALARRNG